MRKHSFLICIGLSFLLCIAASVKLEAQKVANDSTYYETFPDKLTGRLYLSQKFLKFTIPASGQTDDIEYKANTKMNLGMASCQNVSPRSIR